MNSAIFFQSETYPVSGPQLMGRNAAGASFIRGFLEYSRCNQFYIQVPDAEQAQTFLQLKNQYGRAEPVKAFLAQVNEPLIEAGNLYFPGPNIRELAIRRSFWGDHRWSLTGITHTTSSALAMDAITELLTGPVQPHGSCLVDCPELIQVVVASLL